MIACMADAISVASCLHVDFYCELVCSDRDKGFAHQCIHYKNNFMYN